MSDITVDVGEWRLNCRAAGVIIHDNKILFHHNIKKPHYALVGGRVEFGESSKEAVVRELKEELGKDVEVIGNMATVENFFEANSKKYHELMFIYRLEFVNEEDKKIVETMQNIEEKHKDDLEYKWIDINDIDDIIIKPKIVKQVLKEQVFPVHKINYDLDDLVFNKIYNDPSIREIYKQVGINEKQNNTRAHHDFNHIDNVIKLTEQILKSLKCEGKVIEEAKIAACLHDTGALEGKENHAYRSYEFAKNYFEEQNIELENKSLVLDAIKNHSAGFDTDNQIQLALILADKLDIKHTRVTPSGLEFEGMRQMQYIKDINLNIDNGAVIVKFVCDEKINKKELEEYYFLKKVGNAIKAFAGKFDLNYEVYFNEKFWNEIL